MQVQLVPHSAYPPLGVESVVVDVERQGSTLELWYTVFGAIEGILVPAQVDQRKVDGLWTTTCFELFLSRPGEQSYRELNFSASTEWAGYSFTSYRAGGENLELAHPPIISTSLPSDWVEVHVSIPLPPTDAALMVGLSAVLEEQSGHKSYWALAHPPSGPPDFHHPACFALELPPAPAS